MSAAALSEAPAALPQDARLRIQAYEPMFHKEVATLITTIQQQEFALPIRYEEQFDLKDMTGTYRKGKGNFWVALYDGTVVGTIGLIDTDGEKGALKKMFVRAEYRGKEFCVAQKLLDMLLQWARQKGLRHLFLGTTEKFKAAQRFYERNGFEIIAEEELPPAIYETRAKVDTKHYHKAVA